MRMTRKQDERLFRDRCIQCGEPLFWSEAISYRFAGCCGLTYTKPLLRGDLVTVTDGEGTEYE